MSVVDFEAKLPDELWLAILKECDVPTKLACSLANLRLMRLAQVDSVWPPLPFQPSTSVSRRDGWLNHLHQVGNLALIAPRKSLTPQRRSHAREVYQTDARAVAHFARARGQILNLNGLKDTEEGKRILEECLLAHTLWGIQQRPVNAKSEALAGTRKKGTRAEFWLPEQDVGVNFRHRGFSQ